MKTPSDILHSFHGGKSSKRFWGCRLLTIGVYLAMVLFTANIFGIDISEESNDKCYEVITLFFATGGGLLFGGVFESYGKKK